MLLRKSVLAAVAVATLTVSAAFATVPAQTNSCNYQFNTNLRLGAVSQDVQNLQKLLNMDAATKVAMSGAGSMGYETFRFGPATMAAVKKFQAANGISPVSGYVGPLTRGVLNTICSSSVSNNNNTTTNTGSGVVSNSIPVSVLVAGQSSAKMAEFVVSGNGTVTQIELMRTGISNNETFSNVYLYDGAVRLTDSASVLTDGTIRFTNSAGLFPVNGSKTVTVRADIKSGSNGQTIGVAMKSVTMMGGTATPVTGANGPLFSIASADLATVSFSGSNSVTSGSVNAGTSNYSVWKASASIGTRAVSIKNFTLKQIGSAPSNALGNVKLLVNGVVKGTGSVNSNGMLVFDLSNSPAVLPTGAHNIEVRADVVAGSNRTFYMSVENLTDMMFEDSTLSGVFVTPTGYTSVKTAGTITIGKGSYTISLDPAFSTTQIVGGTSNATIGKFTVRAFGEDVKFTDIDVVPNLTGATPTSASGLSSLALYVNGGQIGTSKSNVATSSQTFSLGSQFVVMAGQSAALEVKADLRGTTSSGGQNYAGGSIVTTLNNISAQGLSSSEIATSTGHTGQSLTVVSSSVTFAKNTGYSNQTLSPNTPTQKVGSYSINAQNTEGIRVTNIAVGMTGTAANNTLSNLMIKVLDNSGNVVSTANSTAGGVVNSSNNFTVDVTIPAGQSYKVDVYVDLNSVAAAATVITDASIQYQGVTSNINSSASSVTGQTITVNSATLGTPTTIGATTPVWQYVVGNSDALVATYNFTASNGTGVIEELSFMSSSSPAVMTEVSVNNGPFQTLIGGYATSTGLNIPVPNAGSGVNVPIKVKFNAVGSSGITSSSTAQLVLTAVKFKSGTTPTTSYYSIASNNMTVVASKPVYAVTTYSSTNGLANGTVDLMKTAIAADAAGNVTLNTLAFDVATTTAAATAFELYDGSQQVNNSTCALLAAVVTCTFTGGYQLSGTTPKEFTLRATVSGVATGASVVTKLNKTETKWTDTAGNGSASAGNGVYIFNFPTNTWAISKN